MTLGDIKAQALQLMGFEEYVDGENIELYEDDDNWGPLIRPMWHAVNRCFADLETKRVLPLKRAALVDGKGRGSWRTFYYGDVSDLFEVVRVVVENDSYVDDDHPFLLDEVGYLRIMDFDVGADYAVLYRPRLKPLTSISGNDTVIPLPEVLAAAVPYFVKSEVYRVDEPDEAGEARNLYEAAVEQYAARAEIGRQGVVQTVYALP
ncbi:MAG: hypothetical protein IJX39_04710 [Clostridia bacterium]|nr:hypothetical protein [Clostridia bacterium]